MRQRFRLVQACVAVAATLAVSAAMAPSVSADTISYQLTAPNPAIAPYAGPYADVLVDRTGATTAQITFTSLSNGTETFLLGDGASAAVNVNAATWTVGSFLNSNAGIGFTPGAMSDGGSGTVDGHGDFNQHINTFDGYTMSSSMLSFILTNTSGAWATAADVLAPNASGNPAAAHIFVADCANPSLCDAGTGALATGFATVPEPSTALLVVVGLTALAARRRASLR